MGRVLKTQRPRSSQIRNYIKGRINEANGLDGACEKKRQESRLFQDFLA